MPDTFWPDALEAEVARVSGDDRTELLRQALDRLERVTWHDRWGCSATNYAAQAADFLRRAGLHELADECADEFGVNADSLIAEITREIGHG